MTRKECGCDSREAVAGCDTWRCATVTSEGVCATGKVGVWRGRGWVKFRRVCNKEREGWGPCDREQECAGSGLRRGTGGQKEAKPGPGLCFSLQQPSLFSHDLGAASSELRDTGLTGRLDRSSWDFPGGAVAETAFSQCRVRVRLTPWSGN